MPNLGGGRARGAFGQDGGRSGRLLPRKRGATATGLLVSDATEVAADAVSLLGDGLDLSFGLGVTRLSRLVPERLTSTTVLDDDLAH